VTMVLEEIYEQDFLSCSYGFRPGRSAHQALRMLQNVLWAKRLYWVLDIDIRKYFDSISHSHLRAFLDQRVTDGFIRRMIDKWLKAGAVEDGFLRRLGHGPAYRRAASRPDGGHRRSPPACLHDPGRADPNRALARHDRRADDLMMPPFFERVVCRTCVRNSTICVLERLICQGIPLVIWWPDNRPL
jgi:Reverse transcriptase (RNA-dependent DNA polymerase)